MLCDFCNPRISAASAGAAHGSTEGTEPSSCPGNGRMFPESTRNTGSVQRAWPISALSLSFTAPSSGLPRSDINTVPAFPTSPPQTLPAPTPRYLRRLLREQQAQHGPQPGGRGQGPRAPLGAGLAEQENAVTQGVLRVGVALAGARRKKSIVRVSAQFQLENENGTGLSGNSTFLSIRLKSHFST